MLAAGLLVFHLGLALAGIGQAGAVERGLTLGLGLGAEAGAGSLWSGVRPRLLIEADLGAVLGQSGTILTVMVLSVVGLLLSAPGIELALGRPIELSRDLRVMGVANCLSAGFGGFGSFHAVGVTQLARRLFGAPSRVVGLASSVFLVGVLTGGGRSSPTCRSSSSPGWSATSASTSFTSGSGSSPAACRSRTSRSSS